MTVWVLRNGEFVEKSTIEPSAPYVISDEMPALRHMATGRYHTSKAKFREDTKASGCIEYGNDSSLYKPRKPIPLSREKRVDDIKRTIYDLRNGKR